MGEYKGSLQKRITLFILIGISVILLSLGVTSHFIIKKNINDLLNKKLALSRVIRNNVDNIIKENINRLYDISISGAVDLEDGDFRPEKEALKNAYRYSIFTEGIFLLDNGGNILISYPERISELSLNVLSIEPVSRMLTLGKPVVSNIYIVEPSRKKVLYVLVPLKNKNGATVGVAGGQIDPTSPLLIQRLGLIDTGGTEFIDIVDSNGLVIASSDRSRIFTQCDRNSFFTTIIGNRKERVTTCHVCHEQELGRRQEKHTTVLAFVPLETAPWGISIQEPREAVFSPAVDLKSQFIILGIIFLGTAFLMTFGINRSIVNPLKELIGGADRIAGGDLSKPVNPQGSDEIGDLSRSFEIMRRKLAESMERIQLHTQELETRVEQRTRQINKSQRQVAELLNKVISSQEDERKRIARDLHDSTLQELSAALMRVDMCLLQRETITTDKIKSLRAIMLNAYDGVLAIMQDLRPSLLDDLGLVAAVESLLHTHLAAKSINHYMNSEDIKDKRFRPEVETTLFRIVQEAIVNIARHARAENAFVFFRCVQDAVFTEIEDDGVGFDVSSLYMHTRSDFRDSRGLGILGMKERALLMGGEMEVCSEPGIGTRIEIRIPLKRAEADDVQ